MIIPGILATWMKWHDNNSLADTTLPVGIYFVMFSLLTSVIAVAAWTLFMIARWLFKKTRSSMGARNA